MSTVAAVATACGSEPGEIADDGSVTVKHAFGETKIPGPPTRVVSAGLTEQDDLLALGVVPVAIDRVGKEDTLMLLLALGAVLAWLEAGERPRLWLAAAALAGAAAAAKYEALPLLPALLLAGRLGWGPRPPSGGARAMLPLLAAFAAAHVALNPLILWPAQWAFLWDFAGSVAAGRPPPDGTLVPTEGFAVAGEVLDGKPPWYYALYLGLKSQVVWVVLAAAGLAAAAARRSVADRLLLVWALGYLAVISAVPFGFARYLAPAVPALAILAGVAAARLAARARAGRAPLAAAAAATLAALAVPLAGALPYPTLYVNAIGGGSARALHWTPDDAVGNLGMQRAVARLAREGVDGVVAAADPSLVRFLSRGSLRAVPVEGLRADPAALRALRVRAAIVQPSQVTLGNRSLFGWLDATGRPRIAVTVEGLESVRVYRISAAGRPLR
jgi:hypothetical protein